MTFTKCTTLIAKLILIGFSASLTACMQDTSTTDQAEVSDEQPEVSAALDPSQYFLIDFDTQQVTPLDRSDSQELTTSAVYLPTKGISYELKVVDTQTGTPGIYDISVTLTNQTGQVIEGKYGGIRIIVTRFAARNAANAQVPGGGIANARYMAESFRPFVLTTDF